MQSTKTRRRISPGDSEQSSNGDKQDQLLLSSAICNGEDLSPFVRKAFVAGKPDALLHLLKYFSRSKESEIEEVCKAHYQDFILAVDDLRSLLSDVDDLKSSLSLSNSHLQSVAQPLLSSLDAFIETRNVNANLNQCMDLVVLCVQIVELCARANSHLKNDQLYLALRCIDQLERCYLNKNKVPSLTLGNMLEKHIPAVRVYVEKKTNLELSDWLVEIRAVSRNLGQFAIGQASSARQREEELRMKQRQAEEQSRLSLRDCVYALEEDDDEDDLDLGMVGSGNDDRGNGGSLGFDLTPLYRAYHIHQSLGMEDRFKHYYFETRDRKSVL